MSNRFLLEAKNIIKTFPPTVALNDVHFCLRPGEIHGLMGENGSGKSTMCSIVSGIYPYDSGELFLDGEPYCPKNMIDAAAKGVCMIVQEQGTFASTTVAENIFIGKEKQFHNGIRLDTKKMANAAVARQFFCETRTEFLRKNSQVLRSKSETRSLASTAPKMEGAVHVKGRVLAWGGAAFAAPPLAFCPWGSSYPSVASPASSAASWAATGSVYSDQP